MPGGYFARTPPEGIPYRPRARGRSPSTTVALDLISPGVLPGSLGDPRALSFVADDIDVAGNHSGPRRVALDLPALIGRLVGSVTATSPAGRFGWLTCRRCPQCRLPLRSSSCWRCSTSGTARWRSVTG